MAELTVLVPLGGRDVEMRKPTEGALVVLATVSRALPDKVDADMPQAAIDKMVRNLGTLGKIVDSMVVQDADKDWLQDAMIAGDVSDEAGFDAIGGAGR